ncbi:hypothetical protein MHU86_2551 [Fragilaria crotonensis]|nr:hypothetical protein MHU86_2551 [Fragilaria crotonensis]
MKQRRACPTPTAAWVVVVVHQLAVYCDCVLRLPLGEATWSVEDDWWRLSEAENTADLPVAGEDIARTAAVSMDQPIDQVLSEDDQWIYDSVDTINDSALDSEAPQHAIYDAPGDVIQVAREDDMGREIAMLVRCNESPQDMLIAEGRALAPLTDEERDDVSQLATMKDNTWEITDFFRNAIRVMYEQHANSDGVMKAAGVASWMSKSLNSHVSAHDKRVLATITRFGEYGTGCLAAEAFEQIYVAALNVALKRPNVKMSNRVGIKEQHSVSTIWRDIRNHNILSPVEVEREMKMLEIRKRIGDSNKAEYSGTSGVMDECEILDMGQTFATTTYQTAWADVKEKEFSSHELLEMAADGKTPLHLRDGDFIFIDEESCIGCMQCATTAPSSFLMLDHGRARTFEQRNDPDVDAAVTTCPVTCMHRVSFDELKELEIAREKGDGRTDHNHCGSSKGYTPLHVSRRSTDANQKDSWYHYLKQKCYLSKDCPQRGCYDCPNYSNPGENPYWKIKNKAADHVRAITFMKNGVADRYRKAAEL